MKSAFLDRLHSPERPVIVFDGGMGTNLQTQNLTAEDFGGKDYEGCNEYLIYTKPEAVANVHRGFLEAGADVIETDTFGATSIVLAEYDLADKAYDLNKTAAELAKGLTAEYSTPEKPRFVAGSIGPGTKLPTLGHIDFDTLHHAFAEQAEGLFDGGVDLFIVETCQDVLQIKAALNGIEDVFTKKGERRPIMVSVTMEAFGTMLVGSEMSAALTILAPYNIDILGLNCATGPDLMKEHIRYLSENSPFIVSCIPNAGLPENVGGKAHYKLTPLELKMALMHFVEDLGVQVIGGCCGTRYEHIQALAEISQTLKPKQREPQFIPSAASIYSPQSYEQENSFLIIGERLNASGSKKCRDLLNLEDWDGLVSLAKSQIKEGAQILDVNVDYVGRDGVRDMKELVSRVVTNVNLPLMLDSTEWQKMEAGLKVSGGKCLLNSTNYEDGEERFYKVLEIAKKYGAAIVVGTIDEEGMGRTAEKKFEIAQRAYNAAVNYGIPAYEIFFDPLALPISTGIEEDRNNGKATIDSIRQIRQELPGCHIVLGVSNISFGLNPVARQVLNSVFLHEAMQVGLDAAIVSANKILPLAKIDPEHQEVCRKLIYDQRGFDGDVCVYDPLGELTNLFQGKTTKRDRSGDINLPIEERLKRHIIDGERIGLDDALAAGLKQYPPLEIINNILLDGMKVVGELFGSGQMQLPFVLQSAQTMKAAVAYLEPYMEKSETGNNGKGMFLIATVKGDVHDIGKNLVDIILSNNGYRVLNLGIKQPVENIINAYKEHGADCIAMSGLLVKSTAFMKENLEAFNKEGITVPVILGGAALTPKFVYEDCQNAYQGQVIYGKDAFSDLNFMDKLMLAKIAGKWDDSQGFLGEYAEVKKIKVKSETVKNASENPEEIVIDTRPSEAVDVNIERPTPPFWGTKILQPQDIPIEDIWWYLDIQALVVGQWQFRKPREQSKEEYNQFLAEKVYPVLDEWKIKILAENLLHPTVIYGYFPCQSEGNSLLIFDPENYQKQVARFEFPRQKSGKRLCIADFFASKESGKIDVFPMQAVTVGEIATEYAQKLFAENDYKNYLYFHGMAVQTAEALAEWTHAKIRRELGFGNEEPDNVRDVLAQRHRGSRYSFGYPACPNIQDQYKQVELLQTDRIKMYMDESEQIYPEQSTTAFITYHPVSKYFNL
ncbi:Methionine synthase [Planktothrix agardhii]|jgi:5-methyltetrahydrofolate--homocysteine methyltransferase|uniref:methionine synthase n=1 Tax=Planktothrix agardhii TaxID=1160 RepID=UPI001F336C43|nr:methionine synthase [Planktothrix agardhii]MCF3575379.1 methionine synthase [Planktothrix agardhii 1812]MCF3580827.1 methionine synthase [Planktothrix agardhii 1811]MCF3625425.1 methionine synthase [Planktothrix agardhii 1801]CAD5953223.1 Methionine synthase [Planktothrix agardhii]